ncbi:MAG TPA: VWA domain-containing protein [Acidimicrobiales bacterium]|nr:VWA domain-containing protein [Acidimicrobiales bacterium]
MRLGRRWVMWIPLVVLAPLIASLPAASASAYRQAEDASSDSADIVILVDESGSLSDADVEAERQAAALMALSDLSETSTYTIIGFGSENGPGQVVARVYCERLPIVDSQARRAVADCAELIHSRARDEGNDTDQATALQDAIALLESGDQNASRIVFLLTDGVLDVENSARWGPTASRRTEEAGNALVERILPEARRLGVQIWPLGFGNADAAALEAIAAGGAGPNPECGAVEAAVPTARVVATQRDVINALNEALAGATCANQTDPVSGLIRGGETLRLTVEVPVTATEGSITVTKVDPRVQVTYIDPDGKNVPLPSGTLDDQDVERVGSDLSVEALRVSNPKPGKWTVVLKAPEGLAEQLVDARVLFRGRLSSTITMVPSFPRPGDEVDITVRLSTRRGVISDPEALRGIQFSATVQGEEFEDQPISLQAPLPGEEDASAYTGRIRIPEQACGSFAVTGRVTGAGVSGDVRSANSVINCDAPIFANLILDGGSHRPGDTVNIRIEVRNEGSPIQARISLRDVTEGANLSVLGGPISLDSGSTSTERSVLIGEDNGLGEIDATVRLVTTDGTELASEFLQLEVVGPPSWWERNGSRAILAVAVLLLLVAALLYWLKRRARIGSLSDLSVRLQNQGIPAGDPVNGTRKTSLELAVDRLPGEGYQLVNVVPSSENILRVRRPRPGVLAIEWRRERFEQLLSEPLPVDEGWQIVFRSSGGPGAHPRRRDLTRLRHSQTRGRSTAQPVDVPPEESGSVPGGQAPPEAGPPVPPAGGTESGAWGSDTSDNPWG